MAYLSTPISHQFVSNGRLLQSFSLSKPLRKSNGSIRAQLDFQIEELCESGGKKMTHRLSFLVDRRVFLSSMISLISAAPSSLSLAIIPGGSDVDIEDVTPPIAPTGRLPPAEERVVELFEKMTYSVVNIFDVTLRPQVNLTGSIEVPEGNGSGTIWDKQGNIVTNYHVIGNALSKNLGPGDVVARVSLLSTNGLQMNFEATLVGADKTKDLAVLKIQAPADILKPISIGKSSKLKVGQKCLAIGNPFGFDHTLTVGVVSGLDREINSKTGVTISGGIQTDAAINPGNSGGPLLDSAGNLIGINAAIFTRTGTSAGVGFAIPSDAVSIIVPQLISYGKVVRPGLNVQLAPKYAAKQLNVEMGALVLSVPQGSAGEKAGLSPTRRGLAGNIILGDIILGVGEFSVGNADELYKVLGSFKVGEKVTLKVQRNNRIVALPLTLEENTLN
eukprot:c19495_g1_i1 orf=298-1635(-)